MAHDQYVDKDNLKTYIGISGSGQDTNIDNAINAASRQIDKVCGRYFYQDETVNAKTFTPVSNIYLEVPDISTTTGLIVKVDENDDGTHERTLTLNTDFILKPTNPKLIADAGGTSYYEPYGEIRILNTRSSERFDPSIINNVQVTAKFGFSRVPDAIKQAALIQSLRLFKRKDAPFNVFGNDETGTIELFNKMDPDAKELLKGYRRQNLVGQIL